MAKQTGVRGVCECVSVCMSDLITCSSYATSRMSTLVRFTQNTTFSRQQEPDAIIAAVMSSGCRRTNQRAPCCVQVSNHQVCCYICILSTRGHQISHTHTRFLMNPSRVGGAFPASSNHSFNILCDWSVFRVGF